MMKNCFALVIAVLVCVFGDAAELPGDGAATHGMLVFGEKTIYLSHLPMFHAPHDYQGIWSVRLDSELKTSYLSDRAAHPVQTLYTLVPERFVLPEMAAHPRLFQATLYRGHFERGGVPIAQGKAVFASTVVFRKLDSHAPHAVRPSYLVFGREREFFAAHVISAPPDFDHVLRLEPIPLPAGPVVLKFTALPDRPLEAGKTFTADSGESLAVLQSLYLEFDDLG